MLSLLYRAADGLANGLTPFMLSAWNAGFYTIDTKAIADYMEAAGIVKNIERNSK